VFKCILSVLVPGDLNILNRFGGNGRQIFVGFSHRVPTGSLDDRLVHLVASKVVTFVRSTAGMAKE
jgi:hypothetical protein